MVSLNVTVNSRAVQARLNRLTGRLRDQRPQLLRSVDQLMRFERLRFSGGRLIRTGRLMRSLTDPGSPDQILRASAHGMTFGTRVPYARFHRKVGDLPLVGLTRAESSAYAGELKRLILEDV